MGVLDRLDRGSQQKLGREEEQCLASRLGSVKPKLASRLIPLLSSGTAEAAYIEEQLQRKVLDMALIPAGEFQLGSPEGKGEPDEHPRHKVFLDDFLMDKYPVTVAQYKVFAEAAQRPMREQPVWNAAGHPVVYVNWDDARDYCAWQLKQLPTEAEWEKATRGGTRTTYSFGDDEKLVGDYAWYIGNSSGTTHPVGTKPPNSYGLYDMMGNVYEWVADWYGEDYYAKSPLRNPAGPAEGRARVLRGCAWGITAYYCRSANRYSSAPQVGYDLRGLRCVSR